MSILNKKIKYILIISVTLIFAALFYNNVVLGFTFKNNEINEIDFDEYEDNYVRLENFSTIPSIVPYDNKIIVDYDHFEDIASEFTDTVNNSYQKKLNDAYDIAYGLLGRGGSCFYIASLFVEQFTGKVLCDSNCYQVFDPEPGDVLYYFDGGLGVEHWGIYLDESHSLQGNYNGTTIIWNSIYLNNASYPIFLRMY